MLLGISKKFLTFIIFSFIFISALTIGTFLISQKKQESSPSSFPSFEEKVNYKVEECQLGMKGKRPFSYDYDKEKRILTAQVWVNCCGVEVEVKRENLTYKILEKQYGELCRCMCQRKVTIFDIPEKAEVIFIDKDNNLFVLAPTLKFCGFSTYGRCQTDNDCQKAGCSNQVCQSKFEKPIVTTCQWLNCYDSKKFDLKCRCLHHRCQWTK